MMRRWLLLVMMMGTPLLAQTKSSLLDRLSSPIILKGTDTTAYRDPLLTRVGKKFYLFYTYMYTDTDQKIYHLTAWSTSTDLQHWTAPHVFTPMDQNLGYASPGSLTRIGKDWVLTLQTTPVQGESRMTDGANIHWPDGRARIWMMRTRDFVHWSQPELIRVKGPDVAQKDMGAMIDPFLIADKDVPGKWWCFFKHDKGYIYASTSTDLKNWTYNPTPIALGENPEVIVDHGDYVMFYAPANGVGVMRSHDGVTWHEDQPPITLGQKDWPWAETRLTAGYVVDMRNVPGVGKYVLVSHSMGPGKVRTTHNVYANCNILIAWSDDLRHWSWPGMTDAEKAAR